MGFGRSIDKQTMTIRPDKLDLMPRERNSGVITKPSLINDAPEEKVARKRNSGMIDRLVEVYNKKSNDSKDVEDSILDKSAEIYNLFSNLKQTHPSDINDMAEAIHDIQKIIAVRIARRVKPEKFITKT